jgi:hypothetical protein
MVKLVQVSPTGPRNFISVDEDGVVWRGEIKTYKSGGEYIEWNHPLGVPALVRSARQPEANRRRVMEHPIESYIRRTVEIESPELASNISQSRSGGWPSRGPT